MPSVAQIIMVLILSLSHLFVGKIPFITRNQDRLIPFAGGISLTYVFMALLPKLADLETKLTNIHVEGFLGFLYTHVYLVALTGLVSFYLIDRKINEYLMTPDKSKLSTLKKIAIIVHAGSFSGYFMLTGFIITDITQPDLIGLSLFDLAMLFHFQSYSYMVYKKYPLLYKRYMRWIFAFFTILGGIIATFTDISYVGFAIWTAFFVGILIKSTIREKLSYRTEDQIMPFLAGVVIFVIINLIEEYYKII